VVTIGTKSAGQLLDKFIGLKAIMF